MKQLNNSLISKVTQDRDPSWCIFCDARDRCSTCDVIDFGDADCDNCYKESEE